MATTRTYESVYDLNLDLVSGGERVISPNNSSQSFVKDIDTNIGLNDRIKPFLTPYLSIYTIGEP